MAKYTIIGPSCRRGSNKLENARRIAAEAADRTGGEVSIIHKYVVIAKFGPEGEISVENSTLKEVTIIEPNAFNPDIRPRVFSGRLGILDIKKIIQDWRKRMGCKDEIPFPEMVETDCGFIFRFNDDTGSPRIDVTYTTLEEA